MISIRTEKRFTTSDGLKHDSLREAKIHELTKLFEVQQGVLFAEATTAATLCVQHDEKVLDVLTTKENSLPKARAINGGKKPRAKRFEAAQPVLPGMAATANGESEPATTTAA